MRFRNAVQITADNFSNVFKMLLYRIVTGIIILSLTYLILSAGLGVIVNSAEMGTVKDLVGEFFRALFTGDPERLTTFQADFTRAVLDLGQLVAENMGSIVGSIIGVCIMYLLGRFVNGLSVVAVAGVLNDRMSVFARTRFSSSFFRNSARGMIYQIIYVPVAFVYDVLAGLACWFFFFFCLSHLLPWGVITVLIALALTVTAIVCFEALKMTLISAWLPAVISDGQKVGASLKKSLSARKNFGGRFGSFVVAVYLIIALNVAFALCTFGSALLITLPLSFLFLLCLQFVHYYEDCGKKYFIFRKIEGGEKPDGMSPIEEETKKQ